MKARAAKPDHPAEGAQGHANHASKRRKP